MSRQRLVPIVLTALAGVGLLVTTPGSAVTAAPASPDRAGDCPPGYERAGGYEPSGDALADRLRAATRTGPADEVACVRVNRPESARELSRLNAEIGARRLGGRGPVADGAYAAALRERHQLAAAGSAVPGTHGEWEPIGNTPLIANDAAYDSVNGEGLVHLAGRIQDFAHDPARDALYVSVAQGGVYRSLDRGDHWVSIGDTLPNQTVGSIAFTPANGGTLVVVTGDSNGGGNSVLGTGVYYSTDDGKRWKRAAGVPEGLLGFRVAVDPTNPMEVYAATGGGLFRSVDAGKSFVNVELPTGDCAGEPAVHPCYFANQVTDVVVQSPDQKGNTGGRVVAAVGWRAGDWRDVSDEPQSPGNGLYGSDTGEPGSFTRLDGPGSGFTPQARIGRIELGTTEGANQNHDYLYAIVQDAVKFNGGVAVTDANEASAPVVGYNTSLEGIYVSPDFGSTWVRMQDGEALAQAAAAEGSALGVTAQALGYAPGVQAWYNMWIKPDPTRTDTATGAPTRLLFGLEEVWQNEVVGQPMVGPSGFKVIGRYFSGDTCFFLDLGLPYCPPYRGEPQGSTTTHPDQHGAIFLPGPAEGGVTLVVGNDGGVYRQVAGPTEDFTNQKWGEGDNDGFHTLMPYSVAVGPDGTVWSGLQDNGHMKITPDGKQYMTFGGDGTWSAVDPEDSDIAYEATPGGVMRATSDGGENWSSIDPALTGAAFVNQFALDPLDSSHLVTAGREVKENVTAPSAAWRTVYDLGTVTNPGVTPPATDTSVPNRMSAIDVVGDTIYLGWCGVCDVVTQVGSFKRGIATNYGDDGWRMIDPEGLPARYINNVTIDPDDQATVYVVLGGYGRRWVPPGANGDPAEDVGEGHVFKSTDGGESFVDISGNLPDVPANWLEIRGEQLLVATDFGVFASPTRAGGTWALLGGEYDLPMAPVFHLAFRPNDPNHLYAATYGRGIYRYRFSDRSVRPPTTQPSAPPSPPTRPRRIAATGSSGPALPALGGLVLVAGLLAARRLRRVP